MVVDLTQYQQPIAQSNNPMNNTLSANTQNAYPSSADYSTNPTAGIAFNLGQGIGAPFTGASTEVRKTLDQLGFGAGEAVQNTSAGVSSGLQSIGTGAGKGLNNFAIGAIPAFAIIVGFVLIMAFAKKV